MSLRELNGWSPSTVTVGPDGAVLSVTVSEPRFSRADKYRLLASRRAEQAPRGPHGFLLSEATDPANQFKATVPPPITDHFQVALSKAQDAWRKKNPDADVSTRLWRVEMKD